LATEKSDLYAVTCVLYELITGRHVFPGPEAIDYMRQHMKESPPRLSQSVEVPAALDALVAKGLSKNQDERPVTAIWYASQLYQIGKIATASSRRLRGSTTTDMLVTAVTRGLNFVDVAEPACGGDDEGYREGRRPSDLGWRHRADTRRADDAHGAVTLRMACTGCNNRHGNGIAARIGLRDAKTRTAPSLVERSFSPNFDTNPMLSTRAANLSTNSAIVGPSRGNTKKGLATPSWRRRAGAAALVLVAVPIVIGAIVVLRVRMHRDSARSVRGAEVLASASTPVAVRYRRRRGERDRDHDHVRRAVFVRHGARGTQTCGTSDGSLGIPPADRSERHVARCHDECKNRWRRAPSRSTGPMTGASLVGAIADAPFRSPAFLTTRRPEGHS